jgi:hypothetical protein
MRLAVSYDNVLPPGAWSQDDSSQQLLRTDQAIDRRRGESYIQILW